MSRRDSSISIDRDGLRRYAETLPTGTAVPVTREVLLELVECGGDKGSAPESLARLPVVDLTPEELGAALHRSPVTIRAYCNAGLFKGAYRLRGRQWRIPRTALEAFQATEQKTHQATGAEASGVRETLSTPRS